MLPVLGGINDVMYYTSTGGMGKSEDRIEMEKVYGGKGAGLAYWTRVLGLPTPAGVLLSAATFNETMAASGLRKVIEASLKNMDWDDLEKLTAASTTIRSHVMSKSPFVGAITDLPRWLRGNQVYAVRSSALDEDGLEASFAGQHETILGVSLSEVPDAVHQCWASLFTPQAMAYRHQLGKDPADAMMALVIQTLIQAPSYSGVFFTSDPTGLLPEEYGIAEVVHGLGEVLVSGEATPSMIAFDYLHTAGGKNPREETLFQAGRQTKAKKWVDGQIITYPVEGAPHLSNIPIANIAYVGHALRNFLGETHYDVEWCFDNSTQTLWLLQVRPLLVQEAVSDNGNTEGMKGMSASRGVTRAKAWVLDPAMNYPKDEPFVLVAPMTKPEYLPAMLKAVGFATQKGGMTCHAAIVSRELGKPCVVGVRGLLGRVKTGQMVEVDGDSGMVRVVG